MKTKLKQTSGISGTERKIRTILLEKLDALYTIGRLTDKEYAFLKETFRRMPLETLFAKVIEN